MIITLDNIKYSTIDRRYFYKPLGKGWKRVSLKKLAEAIGIPEDVITDAIHDRKNYMLERQDWYWQALKNLVAKTALVKKDPSQENLYKYNDAHKRLVYEADKMGKTKKEVNADIASYSSYMVAHK